MKISRLTKWAPVLTIAFSGTAMAEGRVHCANYFKNAQIEFFHSTVSKDYLFLDHYNDGHREIWGGEGSIAGKGKIAENKINVALTFTRTGTHNSVNIGKLTGEKTAAGWNFILVPWDAARGTYSSEKIQFNNCAEI